VKIEDVLAGIDGWPVDTVGIGVTDADRTVATHGEVDTVLPFASVTKPLAAYAVLITVQDGRVHLDEPVDVPDAPDGITVRTLLAHAGGLPLDRGGGPIGAPGRKRIYSNWGFEVLGELVEQRVGEPFAEHLRHEVLEPLRMSSTVLDGSPAYAARGTVTDLLAFGRELLQPSLLDDDLHTEATGLVYPDLDGVVPGFGRQSPCDWGLGFERKGAKDPHWTGRRLSAATFGHFGRSGSFLWVDPERGLAAAELADRDFDAWSKEVWPPMNDAIVDALAGDA
jgi:CubicO group peptidase (beta-lactamase class C family)